MCSAFEMLESKKTGDRERESLHTYIIYCIECMSYHGNVILHSASVISMREQKGGAAHRFLVPNTEMARMDVCRKWTEMDVNR